MSDDRDVIYGPWQHGDNRYRIQVRADGEPELAGENGPDEWIPNDRFPFAGAWWIVPEFVRVVRLLRHYQGEQETNPLKRLEMIDHQEELLQEERRAIYRASLRATDPAAKVCPDELAEFFADRDEDPPGLSFPVTVHRFTYKESHAGGPFIPWKPTPHRPLPWVKVRPVAPEYGGKTFLGLYIGDLAISYMATISREGILQVGPVMYNPAIYVPDLRQVIFGCASWWTGIASPDQLREITDGDIESVWYVRALRDLTEGTSSGEK